MTWSVGKVADSRGDGRRQCRAQRVVVVMVFLLGLLMPTRMKHGARRTWLTRVSVTAVRRRGGLVRAVLRLRKLDRFVHGWKRRPDGRQCVRVRRRRLQVLRLHLGLRDGVRLRIVLGERELLEPGETGGRSRQLMHEFGGRGHLQTSSKRDAYNSKDISSGTR